MDNDNEDLPLFERPSMAKRWMASLAARMRRRKVKQIKKMHELKEAKELKKELSKKHY